MILATIPRINRLHVLETIARLSARRFSDPENEARRLREIERLNAELSEARS